ncbi:MAG: hypothetical protein AAFN77_10165 [Planctomycetota bacterium]
MARDIEDFLRRAAERRREQQAKKQPPPQPPQQRQPPPRRVQPKPIEPVIIDDIDVIVNAYAEPPGRDMRDQSVQEHVQSHIDTSDIASHAEQLGHRIVDVAQQVDNRIHKRLDHDISKIDDQPTITDDPSPAIFGARVSPLTSELRQMLGDPNSVGKAIFLAAILKRPDWD